MFDLFRSRDKAVRLMLGGLLVIVAISMLTYLVPNYDTNGPTGNLVLATVGGEDIRADEVQRMVQNAMRGKQLPPDMLPIYIPQMVDDMIVNRAMLYEARRLGFQVTDDQLRTTIMQMAPALFPDGRFVGKQQYAAMLAQQGVTIDQFENDLRRQILTTRLRDVAVEGTVVTPLEIEQAYKKKYEKIKIQYVKIPSDKYKAEVTPTDAELRSYYQANIANYQTPEKKNLILLIADQAKIEQSINVSDDDLRKLYNQNPGQYHVPEQATVRHILFMTQGKPPADDAKIKAQAEDVMNQIKSGKAKFEDMVTKYSEDGGSKDKGGVYANLQRNGQMVKEFEDAAFTQKPGDIGLVKTSYGYHIVQVVSREPAHQQTFDEVKASLASQAKKVRVNDTLQRASDQAQTMLTKDPMHPDKVAADLGMQVVHADGVEPGKPIPEVGPNPDFDQAVAALKIGQVTPAIALANNKVVVAELAGITPPKPTPFEEVKGKVTDAMLQYRLPAKVREKATELIQKAKASSLEQAAKDMGFKVESTDGFIRTDTVAGFGSANYVSQGFASPDGTILGPVLMPDATVVAKVVEHIPADMSKFAEERGTIRDQIKSQKAGDRDTLFREGLKDRLIKEGKIKLHQDAINKLIAGYRNS
jgi:peptidyl-prolyl cis-trans isomerase D